MIKILSYTCWQLCWMSAWLVLCYWGVTAEDVGLPSNTKSNSSTISPQRRYFANDSLIGRPVPCTSDEKICFRHNLMFDSDLDSCEPLGVTEYCTLRVDREEFEQGSGRVVGSCRLCIDQCPGYRMAYDGVCYEKELVHDVICGRDAILTRHPFGDFECRTTPDTPITVQQPEEDGACVIPNLRSPDPKRVMFFNNPFTEIQGFKNGDPNTSFTQIPLECGSDQAACFSEKKVYVRGYAGCHKLLEQGPCAELHVVALDAQAATQGRAEGTCVHVRGGCPRGHKRMVFDGECHENRKVHLVAPGDIIMNQFGNNIVMPDSMSLQFIPMLQTSKCAIRFHYIRVIILSTNILDLCESDDD